MDNEVKIDDKDDIIKNEEELNEAFSAGFNRKDFKMPNETETDDTNINAEQEEIADVEDESGKKNEEVEKAAPVKSDKTDVAADEWDGVPEIIRSRFEKLTSELDRVNCIANAASGQARKLQNQVSNQKAPKPQPTSEQIRAAMTDKVKREELRIDWGNFAAAMDEGDDGTAIAVGDAIDKLKIEFFEHTDKMQAAFEIQRSLDINHPGWQTTIEKEEFKNWLYTDGPNDTERATYERTFNYAQSLHGNSPSESKTLYAEANTYYKGLLEKYPVWARERGNLYADESGTAAIELLDMYKKTTVVLKKQEDVDKAILLAENKKRLEANLSPTSAKNAKIPLDDVEDVEAAFTEGFRGHP